MASPPVIEAPAQAIRRAKVRVGVAITLLITAIGILAVMKQHKTTKEPAAENAKPPSQASISSQETEKPAEPAAPQITGMSSPEPTAEPAPVAPPPPVPGKLPAAPVAKTPPAPIAPTEKTGAHIVTTKPEPPAQVTKPAPEPAPAKQVTPEPAKTAAAKDFEVQLGVFSDMENAKQLQAKLAEHGIPSHTETRVQVGPFKTRAEADQAREKLKALGISSVIAPK